MKGLDSQNFFILMTILMKLVENANFPVNARLSTVHFFGKH